LLSYRQLPTHADLGKQLREWADTHPGLVELSTVGRSWEGREIWLLTLTNRDTGPAEEKPGFLVEANIHAAEITSSLAALHLVDRLLTGHGSEDKATRLLDSRVLYVVPRLNPDGVEHVLDEGRYIRSSVRPHPAETAPPGLQLRDVDGDGRVLFMRVPDQDGPWKTHPEEPRLLVRREPDEYGGAYYRLLLEGEITEYDGATIRPAEPVEGLDLGQNLPTDWEGAPGTPDNAGPYPGSEPEIQAMLRLVAERPNLTGFVTCHTFGGLHLHPPLNDDDPMPYDDLAVYRELGARGSRLTGYTAMSFHDLKYRPARFYGGQLGWYYGQLGLYAWITELWSPVEAAGLKPHHPSRWLVDHPDEDDIAMIRWSDRELDGRGFVDWYPFQHPQLGPVELGGWDMINYWYNPPLDRIEGEVAPHTEWVMLLAACSPRLEIRSLTAEEAAPGVHRVRLVVGNTGWLPTNVTQRALDRSIGGAVTVEAELPDGAQLLAGERSCDLGQLDGRASARSSATWWGHNPGTPDLASAEWLVQAPAGSTVEVTARHPRAGTSRAAVELG
jgi:hypothetical protein